MSSTSPRIDKALNFSTPKRSTDDAEGKDPMMVHARIRPIAARKKSCVTVSDGKVKIVAPKGSEGFKHNGAQEDTFEFTTVLGEKSTQQEVFESVCRPLVEGLFAGENGLMWSYGVTNAGKSYTIVGNRRQPGVLPQAIKMIYDTISGAQDRIKVDPDYKFAVCVNYLEIHNESVYDLLVPLPSGRNPKRQGLKLTTDKRGRVGVKGIKEHGCATPEVCLEQLEKGQLNRQVADTKLNADSSRSHTVFTIKLCMIPKSISKEDLYKDPEKHIRFSKLSIIDLAGSERAKRTENSGARLKEANNINGSLMTLKRCFDYLRYNQMNPSKPQKAVPFRDSKLTRLFCDYFSGDGKAAMVVNINPQTTDYDESLRVLEFSCVARDIKVATSRIDTGRTSKRKARTKFKGDVGVLVSPPRNAPAPTPKVKPSTSKRAASEEVASLRAQLADLQAMNVRIEAEIRDEVATEYQQEIWKNQMQCEERVSEVRDAMEEKYERKIGILDKLNREQLANYHQRYQELADEYTRASGEHEERKARMQAQIDTLLSAGEGSGSDKYQELLKHAEAENKAYRAQVATLEARVKQLQSNSRLEEVQAELAAAKAEIRAMRAKGPKKWGRKKTAGKRHKYDEEEDVSDSSAEGEVAPAGWANVSLEDAGPAKGAKGKRKKFGSWRKRNKDKSPRTEDRTDDNFTQFKSVPQQQNAKRDSDSMRLTDLLGDDENGSPGASPLLNKRSYSRASGQQLQRKVNDGVTIPVLQQSRPTRSKRNPKTYF